MCHFFVSARQSGQLHFCLMAYTWRQLREYSLSTLMFVSPVKPAKNDICLAALQVTRLVGSKHSIENKTAAFGKM